MNWSIEYAPLIPVNVLIILALIGLVLVGIGLFARARGALIRLAALGLIVLALTNPTVREEDREPLNDIAVVITDRSQSQQIDQRMERADAAEKHLREELAKLPNTEVRFATVTSGITSSEDGTRAFEALKHALADVPPERYAGTIMITDGQIHDVPGQYADIGYDGPVHGVMTGRRNERDRRIVLETAPRFGIVGEQQVIKFRVEESGTGASRAPVTVAIAIDGGDPRDISVTPGESTEVEIPIHHGGQNLTELSVDLMDGELSTQNNRAIVVTEGVRDRLRVLLISGEPHPGERTWRNLLKADASVDLVHFTILRPPEKQDGTPIRELSLIAFPTRELFVEKLAQFDLIIFDRYQRRGVLPLAYLANIAGYIENGGAVLVAAGPDYANSFSLYRTPLAAVLPAVPTGNIIQEPYRARITETGQRHPVTRGLPGAGSGDKEPTWGRWFRMIEADAQEGHELMSGPAGKPLIVLARRQEGRIAQMMSDHAWLWARGYDGGGPQAELLRRMAHWLMKEPELEEEALVGRQDGHRVIVERRTMADKAEPVTVTLPSGKTSKLELRELLPGVWQAAIEADEAGIHRLDDGKLKAFVAVGNADPRESAELHSTTEKMQPIVGKSGGGFTWLSSGLSTRLSLPRLSKVKSGRSMAGSGWLGLKANEAYRVKSVNQLPLFGTLLSLAILLGVISLMWYREGR
ncbi:MAG: hypothetical protein HKN11_05395 [Rhizobiales bacterium]|nr:hypothetical protein [Hyphomicrobiales bacterium]